MAHASTPALFPGAALAFLLSQRQALLAAKSREEVARVVRRQAPLLPFQAFIQVRGWVFYFILFSWLF